MRVVCVQKRVNLVRRLVVDRTNEMVMVTKTILKPKLLTPCFFRHCV